MEAHLTRRTFLHTLSAGGSAVLLGGCTRGPGTASAADSGAPWVKDPTPFIQHPTNLETRLEDITGFLTPNSLFFVRNHAPTPRIDPVTYRLRVEGNAIERSLDLTYDDLLALPSHTTIAYLECAGNWRGFFDTVVGRAASGGQWGTGAVGCASWTGISLASVLERAGVRSDATTVNLVGLDQGAFERPMPIEKALDRDTLLAYSMNGEPLPPDHGFPIRAVVPGWAGGSNIKWIGRIVVSSEQIWTKNNTTSYVLIGDDWPRDEYEPAQGAPITTLNVKSALALPWPASLRAGSQRLRGFAYSPHGKIARVQWSIDGGGWRNARILNPVLPHAWVRFEIAWNATAGDHTMRVRATDELGNTQPDSVPFNEKGYLLNIPLPHPVQVA